MTQTLAATQTMNVRYDGGERYEIGVRGHTILVDQPRDLPAERWPALQAVVEHCTVHNSLATPPAIRIDLVGPNAEA
jgi:hypothetical protein